MRQELLRLDNGVVLHKLVKVSLSDLEMWDAAHDEVGRLISQQGGKSSLGEEGERGVLEDKERDAV